MNEYTVDSKQLQDNELKMVIGGKYYSGAGKTSPDDVEFIANIGDIVEVASGWGFGTVRCRIVDRKVSGYSYSVGKRGSGQTISCYYDVYECQELKSHWYFKNGWKSRNDIEIPGT